MYIHIHKSIKERRKKMSKVKRGSLYELYQHLNRMRENPEYGENTIYSPEEFDKLLSKIYSDNYLDQMEKENG